MMQIKNLFVYAFPLFMVFQSCDKIDSPYSEPTDNGGIDTTGVDTTGVDTLDNDTLQRVLLEEYTGHTCPNCPTAHDEAQTLRNTYGDQFVVVSIHAGYYAQTQPGNYSYDFRTQVGNDLFGFFLPTGQSFPTGVVQRKKNIQNNYPIPYSSWGANVAPLISAKPVAQLRLTNEFNSATRKITTTVKTGFLQNLQSPLSLVVYFTEDSILNWQKDGTVNIQNYLHRHVLRGSLNGTWGTALGSTFTNGQFVNKTYTGNPIQADIVPEHVSVIAILYNGTTQQVMQIAEKKLIE